VKQIDIKKSKKMIRAKSKEKGGEARAKSPQEFDCLPEIVPKNLNLRKLRLLMNENQKRLKKKNRDLQYAED
jgi:hypothetical protein